VVATAQRFFQGQKDLVLLEIDPRKLTSRLVYEDSAIHGKFPHIYGPLNVDAVIKVEPFTAP
jgi:uncharacterized protein (DUF952 family)